MQVELLVSLTQWLDSCSGFMKVCRGLSIPQRPAMSSLNPFQPEGFPMPSKSRNAKKPKLAGHSPSANHPVPAGLLGEGAEPEKHHMSFAQHQHQLQVARTDQPLPPQEAPTHNLKSDAQQHQQKPGARK